MNRKPKQERGVGIEHATWPRHENVQPMNATKREPTTSAATNPVRDAEAARSQQIPQVPHQWPSTALAGQSPRERKRSRENPMRRQQRRPTPMGVKLSKAIHRSSRDDRKDPGCTERHPPLASGQKADPPIDGNVCRYDRCTASLSGMDHRAIYCSRRHKEAAKQARDQRKAATVPRSGVCSVCGIAVATEVRFGALPKFCAQHHPQRPCARCGRSMRRRATSQVCRRCLSSIPQPAKQIWTCLCDECGKVFQGAAGTQLCSQHSRQYEG